MHCMRRRSRPKVRVWQQRSGRVIANVDAGSSARTELQ